jgi:hypothetical protein
MEELKNKAETLTDHVGDYVEIYYKLILLNAAEKATGIASVSITSIIVGVLSIFALFFGSLGVGWWLGEELHSMIGGFGIVAGFYLLIIGIVMAFRKQIIPSIQNTIIRKIYEEKDNVVSGPDQRETRVAEAA